MAITYQQIQKTASGDLPVKFPKPFSSNPVVLVAPVWLNQTKQVTNIETVIQNSISSNGCKVTSTNSAPNNYFVNVVAIDASITAYGKLKFSVGALPKSQTQLDIDFKSPLSSPDPVAIVTPSWRNQVGYVETQIFSAASEIDITSGNAAPNDYYVQYAAADRGRDIGSSGIVETGSVNKGLTVQRVYFSSAFANTPVVVVSPWWEGQDKWVTNIETIVNVTPNYFEIASGNSGENYFVNWMAFASS